MELHIFEQICKSKFLVCDTTNNYNIMYLQYMYMYCVSILFKSLVQWNSAAWLVRARYNIFLTVNLPKGLLQLLGYIKQHTKFLVRLRRQKNYDE